MASDDSSSPLSIGSSLRAPGSEAPLRVLPLVWRREGDIHIGVHPGGPHWLATDRRGAAVLGWLGEQARTPTELVALYAREFPVDVARAWREVVALLDSARRRGIVSPDPRGPGGREGPYPGRGAFLRPRLRELWLHTNNSCNLECIHCLVSSGPRGERGPPGEAWLGLLRRARALGATRFAVTGGEPLMRPDFLDLARETTRDGGELVVLTNGTLLQGALIESLKRIPRLHLQVSLDGASPEVNDPIRGAGSFRRIVEGIRSAVNAGLDVSVGTVVCRGNTADVPRITRLAGGLGVKRHHLLWLHERGRATGGEGMGVDVETLQRVFPEARAAGEECGVAIDNYESVRGRLDTPPGTRFDLSGSAVESICASYDGRLYPSPALAGVPQASLGPWEELERWAGSPVARGFQGASVAHKEVCRECEVRFLCGGGDPDNSYLHTLRPDRGGGRLHHDGSGRAEPEREGRGRLDAPEPYCDLYKSMVYDTMARLARERRPEPRQGFTAPHIYAAMGDGGLRCGDSTPGGVETLSSNCTLHYALDRYREAVRRFYTGAAEKPRADLCCPLDYSAEDVAHIPPGVLERAYGCGSPVATAGVRPGETVVDLGSGAGIDVFIAARRVGPGGRAIGIDMTERMLQQADEARGEVARRLGYDAAEFRRGHLEQVPIPDATADLVTSNCVINLSPDKPAVFREIWRILRDHGRMVVSDIVAGGPVPPRLRVNEHLWGECIAGALTEPEFLGMLEETGFHGIQVLRKTPYREVEGHAFYSITVRAYRAESASQPLRPSLQDGRTEKKEGCLWAGHRAIYLGPLKAGVDDEGHLFPRGEPVEVCTATAEKLRREPYRGQFTVLEPGADAAPVECKPGDGANPCC